ncbi:unnamed protein product [Paramecium primaurelia]|uniref:Uncharacterized protein n=1 Tax=Paramecium primaurelia TaxID=5886 RepID=A0A8S1KAP7_PARPR|nr:unnamed protein product [Paramecium primaurelia]
MAITLSYILMEMQQIFVQEDLLQKIRFAIELVRQGNLVLACDQIRTIINSSDRTTDEIQQYTLLYNQSVAYYKQLQQQ